MRVRDMLPTGTFEVLEAADGAEGLNLICNQNPNLIMLDFFLPKMSGWEVYQEIQKQQRLKAIPLVLMSGRKEEVTEKLPEPFEYFAFVEKPFDQDQLIRGIKDAMQKAKKHPKPIEERSRAITASDPSARAAEIEALNEKIAKMQGEIEALKKQLSQVIQFIRQKLQ